MIDREKVVSKLDDLRQFADTEIHPIVSPDNWDVYSKLCDLIDLTKADILAPLKEQDAEWIEYPECLVYEGAYSDSHIVCSACKHVFSTMDNCTEEFDYCPHCGAKMKQERQ